MALSAMRRCEAIRSPGDLRRGGLLATGQTRLATLPEPRHDAAGVPLRRVYESAKEAIIRFGAVAAPLSWLGLRVPEPFSFKPWNLVASRRFSHHRLPKSLPARHGATLR